MNCVVLTEMFRYWQLKKAMASGSEPDNIQLLLAHLRPYCAGLSLCGAGAGGYAVCILKADINIDSIRSIVKNLQSTGLPYSGMDLAVESISVDTAGLVVREVDDTDFAVETVLREHAF